MRITETLNRHYICGGFFRNERISVCDNAIRILTNGRIDDVNQVKMTLATKNPKKKGFRKVYYAGVDGCRRLYVGNTSIGLSQFQAILFVSLKIKKNQPFWLKAEVI